MIVHTHKLYTRKLYDSDSESTSQIMRFYSCLLVHVVIKDDFGRRMNVLHYGCQRKSDNVISQKPLVKFLEKFVSIETLSLKRVQLSDMVRPP